MQPASAAVLQLLPATFSIWQLHASASFRPSRKISSDKLSPTTNQRVGNANTVLRRPIIQYLRETGRLSISACADNVSPVHEKQRVILDSNAFRSDLVIKTLCPKQTPIFLELVPKLLALSEVKSFHCEDPSLTRADQNLQRLQSSDVLGPSSPWALNRH